MAIMQMVFVTMLIAGCQAKSLVARQGGGNPHNCPEHCPFNIEPVCGSNGVTYDNPCLLEAAACQDATLYSDQWNYKPLTLAHYAPCGTQNRKRQFNPGTEHCNTHCNDHYAPVCGSNGQTYTNRCFLELDACQFSAQHPESHHTITMAYDGACNSAADNRKRQFNPGTDHCQTHCSDHYAPVCGSNHQTYTNRCYLELDACIFSAQHPESHHTITVAYDGACNGVPEKRKRQFDNDCPMFCPEYYSPVCGSNGQIYDNICFLESAACIFR
ncbi:hypothetical protein Bbelb_197730 [Branchiostoma belcheri]|nr:hypothetical protein Bbelb_197730 [Branchiostoma belcheri]